MYLNFAPVGPQVNDQAGYNDDGNVDAYKPQATRVRPCPARNNSVQLRFDTRSAINITYVLHRIANVSIVRNHVRKVQVAKIWVKLE